MLQRTHESTQSYHITEHTVGYFHLALLHADCVKWRYKSEQYNMKGIIDTLKQKLRDVKEPIVIE